MSILTIQDKKKQIIVPINHLTKQLDSKLQVFLSQQAPLDQNNCRSSFASRKCMIWLMVWLLHVTHATNEIRKSDTF
jgi:hypothetical protein